MPDFPNIILYAIPIFVISMLLELYATTKAQLKHIKGYAPKDAFASIAMGLGNVAIGFVSKAIVLLVFFWVYDNFKWFEIPVAWWSFVLLFFLDDLGN